VIVCNRTKNILTFVPERSASFMCCIVQIVSINLFRILQPPQFCLVPLVFYFNALLVEP
jgi:hypothetical protein